MHGVKVYWTESMVDRSLIIHTQLFWHRSVILIMNEIGRRSMSFSVDCLGGNIMVAMDNVLSRALKENAICNYYL